MEHPLGAAEAGLLHAFLLWLEASALGEAARHSTWVYPTASVLHILGMGLLLGSIAAFDLRLLGLGLGRGVPVQPAARLLLPLAVLGLTFQVASGLVLFSADASHVGSNPVFAWKLATITLAVGNLALFHRLAGPGLARLATPVALPIWARAGAALSLALWLTTASLGRLIAYF